MTTPRLHLLSQKTDDGAYVPSYEFADDDVSERQRESVDVVEGIAGWLLPEDTLKLYELAYFSPGPILEVGCYSGKSTVVISRALADRPARVPFVSLDVDPLAISASAATVSEHGLADHVVFARGSLRACRRTIPNLRPTFVFVDGDHSLRGVRRDLAVLRDAVPEGGILLFHDFNDPGNADPQRTELGVVEAVTNSWVAEDCEFGGVFGCCGLFVRRRGGVVSVCPPDPLVLELLARDSLGMQVTQRLRRPLGRRFRSLRRAR